MSRNEITLQLNARVDADNRLNITVNDDGDVFQLGSINDLIASHQDAEAIILELDNFEHKGTAYEVFGKIVHDDGQETPWQSSGSGGGIRQRFAVPAPGASRPPAFVIGARSQSAGVSDPIPMDRSGPGPATIPDKQGERPKISQDA